MSFCGVETLCCDINSSHNYSHFTFYCTCVKKTIKSIYLPTGSTVINTAEANEG